MFRRADIGRAREAFEYHVHQLLLGAGPWVRERTRHEEERATF